MGGKRESMIEKILPRPGFRIEEWRRKDQARQAEAEADRDKLRAEAKEREELRTLEALASEKDQLVEAVPV